MTGLDRGTADASAGRPRRQLDRRLWFCCYVAATLLAMVITLTVDSVLLRSFFLVTAVLTTIEAAEKANRWKRDGRWMDPLDTNTLKHVHQRRRFFAVTITVAVAAGLIAAFG